MAVPSWFTVALCDLTDYCQMLKASTTLLPDLIALVQQYVEDEEAFENTMYDRIVNNSCDPLHIIVGWLLQASLASKWITRVLRLYDTCGFTMSLPTPAKKLESIVRPIELRTENGEFACNRPSCYYRPSCKTDTCGVLAENP